MAGHDLELTTAVIDSYLQDLGMELERRGFKEPVRIMIVGGAFMVSQLGNRDSTGDVDVVLLDLPATTDEPLHPRSKKFREAVSAVGRQRDLGRKWCNDDATFFLREFTPEPLEGVAFWKAYGMLHLYLPSLEYILVTKLVTFRPKDYGDIEALLQRLQITAREQAQAMLARFVPETPTFWEYYELNKTLSILFDN